MASYSWNGSTGGWGTIANWTGGIPNSTTADATIAAGGTYTVTIETGKSYTVDSVTLGDSTAILDVLGSLTLGGTLATFLDNAGVVELGGVISGGTVDIEGGSTLMAAGGALTGNKSFNLGGSAYINVTGHTLTLGGTDTLQGYVIGTGELVISGQATLSDDTYFEAGTTLDDTGTITLQTSNQLGSGGTVATLLTIGSGGIYDITGSNIALSDDGTVNIVNAGTLEMTATTGSFINVYYNSFTNATTGTISVAAGADITLLGTNAALFGHVTGGGELFADGGTTTLESGLTFAAGTLGLSNYDTLLLASSFSLASEFDGSTSSYLDLNTHNLTLAGTGSVRGYVYGVGTLDITGTVDVGGLYLASGTEELVAGTAILDQYTNRLDEDGGTAASILSIASTGTFDITAVNTDIDYNTTLGTILNAGLFENIEQTPTFTSNGDDDSYFNVYTNFTNATTGTIYVGTADDISLLYGQNVLAGTITGPGDLYLGQHSTTSLEASLVLNNGRYLTVSDGSTDVILESNRAFTSSIVDLINGATFSLNGYTASFGTTGTLGVYVTGPGTIDVSGTFYQQLYMSSGVTEVVSGAAIQNNTVYLDDDEGTAANVISVTSTGTYDITSDNYIYNGNNNGTGSGTIINAGLFEKTGFTTASNIYTDFTQSSTGTIFIAADDDISLITGTSSLAGTITGPGYIYFGQGETATLDASLVVNDVKSFAVSDGGTQLILGGSETYAAPTVFTDQNSGDVQLNGNTLTLAGRSQFSNAYVSGPGTLLITGTADFNGLNIIGTATVIDHGTVIQDGYDELGINASANVTLSIVSGATYDIINDNPINPQGTSVIDNAGLFEKTAGGGISDIYAPFTNLAGATLDAASGTIRLDNSSVLAGTINGAGELELNGGTVSLAVGTINVATLGLYSAELVLQNNVTDTHEFTEQGGTLDLNGFNLTLGNPGDDLANGYLLGGGTLSESSRANVNNYYLSDGAVLKDTGTITQDGGLTLGTFGADTAMLTITSTGIYDILNDSSVGTDGAAAAVINNSGLFEKTAGTGATNIYAIFNNNAGATLAVNSGYIQLNGGGMLNGTLTGAGTLYLNQYYAAQTYTLASTAVVSVATFSVDGATLDLLSSRSLAGTFIESGGDVNLGGFNLTLSAADNLDNAYLSGPGTLDVTGVTELKNYYVTGGATLLDAGTIIADGNLQLGNAATDSGTLSIASGGVYNFVNDSYIYISGTGVLNNAGLIEKTADNGNSLIYATINNTGVIDATRGFIVLAAGGTLGGTLEGAGTIATGGGTFMLGAAAVVSVATFEVSSSTVDLLSNRVLTDTFLEEQSANISLSGHTLTLTAPVASPDFLQGYASGPGTVDVTGASDLNGYNLTGGAVLLDAGTLTMDAYLQIGESSTDTATLSVATTGTFGILNDSYLDEDGTVAIVNAGLFEKTGSGTGRSYIQGAFTNAATGTLAVTSGFLEIQQGPANGGLVTVANATLQLDTGINGTGRISLGGNATLYEAGGTIAATESIVFSGTNNLIEIANAAGLAASVTSFTSGDTIDLQNTLANGYTYGGGKLTLTENGTVVTTLAVATVTGAGTFSLVQDGASGTDIEVSTPGSITQPGTIAITADTLTVPNGTTTADFNNVADWSNGSIATATNTAVDHGAGTITDSGIDKIYSIDFNNAGLVFDQTAGTLTVIDGGDIAGSLVLQSAGASINDEAGVLTMPIQGTIAGTLGGTGAIEVGGNPGNGYGAVTIAAGAVLSVATLELDNVLLGANETYAGVFDGPGADFLGLNGFTLDLTGQALFAPTYEYSVSGPGELIVAGSAKTALLYLSGGTTLDVSGTMTEDQGLNFNGGNSDTSSLTIASTGTFDLLVGGNINGDSNGATTLVNAGLLERTGDNSYGYIQYLSLTQTSAGELDAANGTLIVSNDSGTLAGTLAGNFIDLNGDQMTIAAGAVLNVATLQINGGNTLTLGGSQTYAGNFDMSGQSGGTLALGSFGLDLTGAAELGGEYVAGTGTLTVASTADVNGMELVGSETLRDAGTITQDGGLTIGQYATDTASLLISAGDVYNLINDSNIGENGTAAIINNGLFEKTADFGNSYIAPAFTNASTGTLDIATGQLILQNGGSLNGTIEGAGTLYLQNTSAPDTTTLAGSAIVTVATINVNDTLVLENARTFTGTLIDTNVINLNGFAITDTGSVGLDSYVEGPGTLTVTKGDINGLYLYQDASLVVKGTVTQDGGFTMSNTGTDNTALSIASGAVFDLLTDNSINANGPAKIVNTGMFEKTGDYGVSYIYPTFNNTGTVDVVRGFLDFESGGSLSGTIEGGKDGTISDGGIIESGGTLTIGASAAVSVTSISVNGGDLSFGGNLTYAGTLNGTGGSISLNGHTISLTSPYLGDFYLTGPGTLDVSGTATLNGLGEISGAVLVDKGTIIQDGGYQLGYSATDTSELSIISGATFDIITDNYIGASGTVGVVNAGLFEKTADNGYSGIQSAFTNQSTGVINVTHGTLAFQGGGVLGGTLKGTGEIQLDSNVTLTSSVVSVATLDVAAAATLGSNLTYAGDFILNYADTLTLNSHALLLSGATSTLIGAFEGPGSVTVSGSATVQLLDLFGGATLVDTGVINQIDELRFSLNDNSSDTLSIAAHGTYNIQDDSNFHNYGNASVSEVAVNAGLLEKTGDTGISELEVTLTNTGTVLVDSGILQIDAVSNLAGGTLTGGSWVSEAGLLGPTLSLVGGTIAVDAASVTLSGAGSELIAGGTLIEQSLTSIATGGTLAVLGGRGFTAAQAITDNGGIVLQGGTFAAPALTVAAGGTVSGYGTLAGPVTDNGLIDVTGSTLTIGNALTGTGSLLIGANSELILDAGEPGGINITFGGSHAVLGLVAPAAVLGTLVSLNPSDTIDLIGSLAKSATISGGDLIVTLNSGGTLSYALSGNNALDKAATSSDGSGGTDITIFRQATAGTIAPATVNFGQHHAGTTLTQTYKIANTTAVDPYSENLDGSMGAHSAGITDSGSFTGLAPGATNSTSLMASLVTTTGGVISGTATVNLETDGNGVGMDSGTMALPSETVTLTGTIFNYATASSAAPNPVNFGEHHVGTTVTQQLTLANTAVSGSYSENLDAKFSGTSAAFSANGSVSELVAGATNVGGLSLTLHTGTAGVQSGATTLALTSDGKNIDSLGTTALASETVTVSGTLFNYATAATVTPNPISFGEAHTGATLSQHLIIDNIAAAGIYSENLDAKFSGTSSDLTGSGSVSELAAGGTNTSALSLSLHSGTGGAFTGTGTVALTSDGTGIDTLASTALASQTVTVTGTLFNYATETVAPKPVAFGQHHVGDTLSQTLTITNGAAAGAYSENLDAHFSGSSANVTTSGSISELAAGSVNTALGLVLSSGTAGTVSGNVTLAGTSEGTGIDTLGTTALAAQTIAVSGTLFNYATASTEKPDPLNFGIVHVGATISNHYITLSNTAVAGKYSENLDGTLTGTTGSFTTSGALSELLAGKTSTASLGIVIQTGTAGTFSGTTTLGLTSDGKNIDSLGTTALASQIITLSGTVNNYATATVEAISGAGTLSTSGTTIDLNFGSVTKGATGIKENLGILNSATGPADNLGGSFSLSAKAGFTTAGFGTFSAIGAGSADTAPTITLNTGTLGTFTDTIILDAKGSNASGYSGTLAPETIVVTGTVVAAGQVVSAMAIPASKATMSFVAAPAATPAKAPDIGFAKAGLMNWAETAASGKEGGSYVRTVPSSYDLKTAVLGGGLLSASLIDASQHRLMLPVVHP